MEFLKEHVRSFLDDVQAWCQGRQWPVRALFWGWLVCILVNHFRDPQYQSLLGGLNLGIHEFGHLICSPLGQFLGVAGGSLVQCLVPVISLIMFYRQEDYFAFCFSLVWLGTNLLGVAIYIADSRALQLDLVSPFGGNEGEITHDWNYLLNEMGLLSSDTQIAATVRWCALAVMIVGVAWGAWLLWLMVTTKKKEIGADWKGPDLTL